MSSLYLHIPFCAGKCPYCDFYSGPARSGAIPEYLELLQSELQLLRQTFPHTPSLETIYLGGGTPSLLNGQQLEQLLRTVDQLFAIADNAEITLEANPGELTLDRLQHFRSAGVNRLSVGVQSLQDRQLQWLGRRHSAAQGLAAVDLARSAGFDNLSLDLIFALPDQPLSAVKTDVEGLLTLNPEHISIYGLTLEPDTPLGRQLQRGLIHPLDEDLYADQYQLLADLLTTAGYEHYEIANFARPGWRCRHNQVYWRRQECLAAGTGAHGFSEAAWGRRWWIPADLKAYREHVRQDLWPGEPVEKYDRDAAMREAVYLALRTSDGIDLENFAGRYGSSLNDAFPGAREHLQGYLQSSRQRWSLNRSAWLIYDHLISFFL